LSFISAIRCTRCETDFRAPWDSKPHWALGSLETEKPISERRSQTGEAPITSRNSSEWKLLQARENALVVDTVLRNRSPLGAFPGNRQFIREFRQSGSKAGDAALTKLLIFGGTLPALDANSLTIGTGKNREFLALGRRRAVWPTGARSGPQNEQRPCGLIATPSGRSVDSGGPRSEFGSETDAPPAKLRRRQPDAPLIMSILETAIVELNELIE
jgi:hypothetical protein